MVNTILQAERWQPARLIRVQEQRYLRIEKSEMTYNVQLKELFNNLKMASTNTENFRARKRFMYLIMWWAWAGPDYRGESGESASELFTYNMKDTIHNTQYTNRCFEIDEAYNVLITDSPLDFRLLFNYYTLQWMELTTTHGGYPKYIQ